MINYADKMEQEARLKGNLADWMERHGTVVYRKTHSSYYCGVLIREIEWRGSRFRIVDVDGMTCEIEKIA